MLLLLLRITLSTYIGACFSSAKIASLGFKPYFSRTASLVTCISSRGFPKQKRGYVCEDMLGVFRQSGITKGKSEQFESKGLQINYKSRSIT